MISNSHIKYRRIIGIEDKLYMSIGYKGAFLSMLMKSEVGQIRRYVKLLRLDEFLYNYRKESFYKRIRWILIRMKRNRLGLKLGINIPINVFDEGLLIYHCNGIVVHADAKVGKNCKLHGGNCIGNNGLNSKPPQIGDNVDIGYGACVIGDIIIADDIIIGANAVVNKSHQNISITIAGVPAKMIK